MQVYLGWRGVLGRAGEGNTEVVWGCWWAGLWNEQAREGRMGPGLGQIQNQSLAWLALPGPLRFASDFSGANLNSPIDLTAGQNGVRGITFPYLMWCCSQSQPYAKYSASHLTCLFQLGLGLGCPCYKITLHIGRVKSQLLQPWVV